MKCILLLLATICLPFSLAAQGDNWNVFLRGHAVKSIDFENEYVWVTTDSFLVSLNTKDNIISSYQLPEIFVSTTAFLKVDKDGVKWIVRSNLQMNSIFGFDGETWNKIEFRGTGPVTSLAVDRNNNKWITAIDGMSFGQLLYSHLYKLEQNGLIQYTSENSGLVYDHVSQVTSDKDGNIWIGNYGNVRLLDSTYNALVKYDGNNWMSCIPEKLPLFYKAIYIDNLGDPWIQVPFQGVVRKLNTVTNSWSDIIMPKITHNLIAVDEEGRCWFNKLQQEGIVSYDGSTWDLYTTSNSGLPSEKVFIIAVDSDGTKWIGTGDGLASFNESGLNHFRSIDNLNHSGISSAMSLSTAFDNLNPLNGQGAIGLSNGTEIKMKNEVELYPNPVHDYLILNLPDEIKNSTLEIMDIQGRILYTVSLNGAQNRLDISHFPAGVYLARIQAGTGFVLKKFVRY